MTRPTHDDKADTQSNEDKPIRIVAAAVRKHGVVFTGVRHSDCIADMVRLGFLTSPKDRVTESEQGFVDTNNVFLDRYTAKYIALAAGQLDENHVGILYSEDLWK